MIDVYDGKTLELVGTFDTMCEAAKFCGSYPGTVSRGVANNYSVNGYRVAKHGEPLVLPVPQPKQIKRRKEYAVFNGFTDDLLGVYRTQVEIAEAFGISAKCVSWAIKNKKKTHNLRIEEV